MVSAKYYPEMQRRAQPARPEDLLSFFKRKVPLFRRVPEPALCELLVDVTFRRYAQGQTVCRTGDPAREIWIVHEGRLTVNQCGWKGAVLSIEIMVPGDVSGLAAVACRTYPGGVIATRESSLIVIPRETAIRAIEKHPELAREILYAYGQRIHYIETLLYLSKERVEKRMIAALIYLYHKFGFTIPLSRAEIGQMAGTTPETAIRVLRRLQEEGLVDRRRKQIFIYDLQGLKSRLEIASTGLSHSA